jgi:tetratricopeptide (TPR) repeat protein
VIEFEWTGSFADARNVSLEAATGDWLMYLDADEVLVPEDAPRLRELTGHTWREAFYLVETNFTGDLEDGMAVTHNAMRVWRNRPEYRFKGRVHEQFAYALPGYLPERFESTTVRVEHYGYLGAVRDAKEKSRRNLELLEKQAADGVDTPFHAFNMGSEYAAAGDEKKALASFQKAWDKLSGDQQRTSYGYMPSLTNRLVKALRICGDLDGAEARAGDGLKLFPGFTDLVLEQAKCARARGDLDAAVALTERCIEMGDAPSAYSSTVGSGTYLALLALAELHTLRGRRAEAEQVLLSCLERYPAFLGAVLPLASAMLASGKDAAEVVDAIESRVTDITPSVNFMLGAALYESGAAVEAEVRFAAVLERQPASGPARVALSETLLSQSRYAEAAAAAAAIAAGEPLANAARRAELFALLVSDELDAAAATLANGRSDLAEGDLALFDAWLSAARGGPLPPRLPVSSASLLVVTLEALLRVREVDAFGMLVPLVDVTGLPSRDRRELLASMYLRRGFLDSAAEEWIGVVEDTGPDAGAMLGLAQVAAARELREDALVFATEARELDPSNAGAARLIESLAAAAA